MNTIKLISSQIEFQTQFERCCKEYSQLEIFTAWVGNPGNIVPYSYLDNLNKVDVYLGISFDQSSPDGIEYLMNKKYKVVIVDDNLTFHPKLYFFKSNGKTALLMGSSNFTYSGFFDNSEANILLEGKDLGSKIKNYLGEIKKMIKNLRTFTSSTEWLDEYREKYEIRQKALRDSRIEEETEKEEKLISYSSWLSNADWKTYMKHIDKGLKKHTVKFNETVEMKLILFRDYETNLKTPWKLSLLDAIENRRKILGIKKYGWLGHIGSSGRIQQLLANGTLPEKQAIVNTVNRIAKMQTPLNFSALKRELVKLGKLGPTIKVWGRLLAITRPDIYCTISSPNVKKSLSVLLRKSQSYFETTEGYIELLKLVHQSPWYNTLKPKDEYEEQIWNRRVAFLDEVFY